DERDAEAPLFAFVNLIGAHSPYDSSGAFRTRFLTDVDRGPTANHWREVFLGTAVFEERELQRLRDLYDGEIAHVDSLVRGMVEELRRAGLIEDTILVVTSDHGENLGEHGLVDHVFSLYRTTTQVPLIVRAPGLLEPGTRVAAPVQLTDVFATLARRAGVENRVTQRTELGLVDAPGERLVFCEYGFPRQAFEAFDPRL
ncbi:MAG: sulfatase-like hydrolase/transferase, partial [Microthrixaceae bacterium]|nr:sulfatase-like hydrolase/transferase [Microthrixaceae bacterium]